VVSVLSSRLPAGKWIPELTTPFTAVWQTHTKSHTTNNFPEFTGRILRPAKPVVFSDQSAITIEEIEKHIIEIAFEKALKSKNNPISGREKLP
jgi:glutamate synthase (NADPH/NADH) small chain